jgi:outer membrane biosynthesis protein TonB
MEFAALCSGVLHLLVIAALAYGPHGGPSALASSGEPLVVQLRPQSQERTREENRRLVAPGAPTTDPIPSTDAISTERSKASDMSGSDGEGHAPAVDKVDEFDAPGGGAPHTVAPQPEAKPVEAKKPEAPAKEAAEEKARTKAPNRPEPSKTPAGVSVSESGAKPSPREPKDDAKEKPKTPPQEDMKIAKAEPPVAPLAPPSLAPAVEPGPSHGRVQGGVKNKGFLGFEAERSEMAPYLREIQQRVEKRWRATLQLKYSGVSQTQAVVDCEIGPDGKLVSVQIVDPGNSVSYAPLCKESIEKAGPFSPFPFTVPDAYRSKNLEIRWTFNFM